MRICSRIGLFACAFGQWALSKPCRSSKKRKFPHASWVESAGPQSTLKGLMSQFDAANCTIVAAGLMWQMTYGRMTGGCAEALAPVETLWVGVKESILSY